MVAKAIRGQKTFVTPSEGTGGGAFSACRIYLSATLTPSGNLNPIPFDASDLDTDGYANLAANRIDIPTGFGGWFRVTMRVGVSPQAAVSSGYAAVFLRTVAAGIRDDEHKGWHDLEDLRGHQAQYRIDWVANLTDGTGLYATWQDSASGGSGFYIFGQSSGSGIPLPETYLEVVRLGDA